MDRSRRAKLLLGALLLVVMLASWWSQEQRQRAAAGLVQRVGEAATLLQRCRQGDPAAPLAELARLAAAPDAPLAVKQAHEACVAHVRPQPRQETPPPAARP